LVSPVDLVGNDTDPDDDILVVTAIDAATSQGGTVAPQGTRWIYTPPSGFLGTDSFGYTITDGRDASSSTATVEVVEGGGVVIEITRDGNLDDWPAGHFMVADPDDISGPDNLLDMREIHLTVQNNRLYVGYVNEGPVVYNWAYTFYIDTDKNPATGYLLDGIGADYIIQENEVQAYAGTGDDWVWQTVALATPAITGDTAELFVPLSALGGATQVRMVFIGDNLAYEPNGAGEDHVPDAGAADTWIHYDFALNEGSLGDPDSPPAGGIDGDLGDWPPGHFVLPDADDVSGAANKLDLRALHVRAEAGNLVLGYVNEEAVVYNYAYLLYIDTDSSAATGFQFEDIGADFIIQDDVLQAYAGTGPNWAWTAVQPVTSAVLGDTVELSAPLAAMGNPFSMRLQFYGDNQAYAGGTTADLAPDAGTAGGSYVQFTPSTNSGTVGGPPPDPGNDADADGMPDSWELLHGLNPADPNDGALDKDGDGQTNFEEYVFGTSPGDPADFFAVSPRMNPSFEVVTPGKAGRTYTLLRAVDLAAGPWQAVASAGPLASDQVVTLQDPAPAVTHGYYRVAVEVSGAP
ncbi:MAG: cadherin-like domain-containing protein, partial [Akkermansiaceae bacterium]|nr:cadherin-like domain-containing protein [Akkermansiaceae bacterium]